MRVSLLSVLCSFSFAAFADVSNTPTTPLNREKASVETLKVYGQRNELNNNELVENNSIYTELNTYNASPSTIADLLSMTPGLTLTGQGGLFQSYSIRGFSKWRIQTVVEGTPLYTDRRAGNSASFLPSSLLSSYDVQKGPSSTLYGSNALGGVIHLNTLDFGASYLSVSGQSNDQQTDLSAAFSNEQWLTAINYRIANNAYSSDGTELNSQFEQITLLNKFRTSIEDVTFNVTWLPSVGKDIGKSASSYPNESVTTYPSDVHSLFIVQATKQDQWHAKVFHHYQNWDTDILRVNSRRNETAYQAHTLGASVLSAHQLLNGQGRFGVDWINRQGVSITESEYDLSDELQYTQALVDAQQHNVGIFSDFHWQWNKLGLSAGLRYDLINQRQFIQSESRSDQAINASLLTHYAINTDLKVQAEWSTGFRFPTLTELYFNGETPRGKTIGNPDLAAEQSHGLQLTTKYALSDSLQLSVSGYAYFLSDYIERYFLDAKTRSYRNLDKAEIFGVEANLQADLQRWGLHKVSYQWQKGEDNNNLVLADIQPQSLTINSHWQLNTLSFTHTFAYQMAYDDVAVGEKAIEAYLNWAMSLTYEMRNDTSITLWADNLLDENNYAVADEDAPLIQGRNFGVKVHYSF